MAVTSLSWFKESGMVYVLVVYCYVMINKTIPGKKISQPGQKTGKVLVKIIFTQKHVTVLIKKSWIITCLLKCS